MSSGVLDKLKIKGNPKKIQQINVVIPKPKTLQVVSTNKPTDESEISDDTITDIGTVLVFDGTSKNNIDRKKFLNKLKNKMKTQQKLYVPADVVPADAVPADVVPSDAVPADAVPVDAVPADAVPAVPADAVPAVPPVTDVADENPIPVVDVADENPVPNNVPRPTRVTPDLVIIRYLNKRLKLVQAPLEPTVGQSRKSVAIVDTGPNSMIQFGDEILQNRIGVKPDEFRVRANSYYLNNRELFISFITSIFAPYKKSLDKSGSESTCERDDDAPFSTMGHQKIVRDYISTYSPYRGVLLFHGLGSGKTCSSIAIAEGLKSDKQVMVMTPASLRTNYIEELKKCGDDIYKKNQFWEFVKIEKDEYEKLNALKHALSLPLKTIQRQKGAWLMNVTKEPNFKDLSSEEKKSIDKQLDEMIRTKYKFLSYNGMRESHLTMLSENYTKNPFDNKVVIIDEAHNFVSRIVNKLGKKDKTMSVKMYDYLMEAENARIILLTGTPIINYPNEIAILFNILRGRIKTWTFKLEIQNTGNKVSQQFFEELFNNDEKGGNIMDYIDYKSSSTTLVVTRNPFGFVNKIKSGKYDGVHISDNGEISDKEFVKLITRKLKPKGIIIKPDNIKVTSHKALPDNNDEFKAAFIDTNGDIKDKRIFQKRILGLTSYFRDMESLMPKYDKADDLHIVKIPMSDYQLGIYEKAREQERKLDDSNAKKLEYGKEDETVSTYRIFSRAFCNFVFPDDIIRPLPGNSKELNTAIIEGNLEEDDLDSNSVDNKLDNIDGRYEADELLDDQEQVAKKIYDKKVNDALLMLEENNNKYLNENALETYSPKFLKILKNLQDEENKGLHLVYSQFRTLEGIGIMKLVLEANGFAQFKIKRVADTWELDIEDENRSKPMFALYTGTESSEEREIIRNAFNGAWNYLPSSIENYLQTISSNNLYGEIIKVLMITASGAEGISLKNVRYVHITEPYWHPVRSHQVIGRARRICSHQDLPEDERTVDVFIYMMTFSEEQKREKISNELRRKDKSKLANATQVTSDETLYETASLKERIINKILLAIKEASFDCTLHSNVGNKEGMKCFTFGSTDSENFAYKPSQSEEDSDKVARLNQKVKKIKAIEATINGIKYAYDKETRVLYDYESYMNNNPVAVKRLDDKDNIVPL